MMVRLASRMFSAISFGVFCRDAPSTKAIIRSMKVSPGFDVICTTIRSESTFVPPVTDERSPPDSRITGADSPVMADSSTLATPSTTSPSPGIVWPASTITTSPRVRDAAGTSVICNDSSGAPVTQPVALRAIVSERVRRNVSACALPRPSATASAMFAKSVVSQSHTAMTHAKTVGSLIARIVASTEPISTMNITGLCTIVRGSSLRAALGIEVSMAFGSRTPADTRWIPSGSCGAIVAVAISGLLLREVRVRVQGSTSVRPQ